MMWLFRGIYNLFAAILGRGPQPGQVVGYGFAWLPNTPYGNFQVVTLRDTDPPGLYVSIEDATVNAPASFFDDANSNIGIIFQPQAASPSLTNAVQHLTTDANLLDQLEGFLKYTHDNLTYIYATPAGQNLIDGIRNSQHRTYIRPSGMGNQIQGAGDKLCFVARAIINSNLNLTPPENLQLLQELATASGAAGQQAQFQWLAQQVNQMPLYTLFEQENAFPQTFLQNNRPVNAQELEDWFDNGTNSVFYQNINTVPAVNGVNIFNFLKLAVIVALHPASAAGAGGDSAVSFDVHDWSANTIQVDRNMNTVNDRPPAIGLAHELIHAYYNAIGREPGNEFGDYSTTLAECIAVGLGPAWHNNAISENAIRQAWPPGVVPVVDLLNNRNPGLRTIYTDPQAEIPPTTAAQMRQRFSAI